MPELPEIEVYVERLAARLSGQALLRIELASPFLLRTVEPPVGDLFGRTVTGVRRLGKRIVFDFDGDLHLVLHLMIAGRLRWRAPDRPPPGRTTIATLAFEPGTVHVTEASSKKRASLHVVRGEAAVREFDRGGVDPLLADETEFAAALGRENRTLKRALTDPRIVSGVGNAWSDEILFHARLSPVAWTARLDDRELGRLWSSAREVLSAALERRRAEVGDGFPEKVTAFGDDKAVHGRYRAPCPVCESPIQRIRYASNECDYCPTCQTEGRLLADRGLSRLMRDDWPRTLEELEERRIPPREK